MRLKDYTKLVKGKRCRWCNGKLSTKIDHYPHPDGWVVEDFSEKQWLSVKCLKCHYDWSLWKIGIPKGNNYDKPR